MCRFTTEWFLLVQLLFRTDSARFHDQTVRIVHILLLLAGPQCPEWHLLPAGDPIVYHRCIFTFELVQCYLGGNGGQ